MDDGESLLFDFRSVQPCHWMIIIMIIGGLLFRRINTTTPTIRQSFDLVYTVDGSGGVPLPNKSNDI